MQFTDLIDLASSRLGGAVLAANDEFFASKENLLRPYPPVYKDGKFTDHGKWIDGWETRRRRTPGNDWCIIRLGLPGVIRGVLVDTRYFKGNYPEYCSIEACETDGQPGPDELNGWVEILPKSRLAGDTHLPFRIEDSRRFTHIRFNIFPDGGVARLRVYGEVSPNRKRLDGECDLASVENGAAVTACSDMFFGSRHNLIMPGRAINMSDGWETRRRRTPGHDWVIIKLAGPGVVRRIKVDTSFFKGNYPERCSLDGGDGTHFEEILPQMRLQPDAHHWFEGPIRMLPPVTHVRFNIFPDGGVARLRVWGVLQHAGLARLNALSSGEAEHAMLDCCPSKRWARRMTEHRPFVTLQELWHATAAVWQELDEVEQQEILGVGSLEFSRAATTEHLRQTQARLEEVFGL